MATHLHQKLAFVTHSQIHATANCLDMYIKSSLWLLSRYLKMSLFDFFEQFIFETEKIRSPNMYYLQRRIYDPCNIEDIALTRVNCFQPLYIFRKSSILDVADVLVYSRIIQNHLYLQNLSH